MSYLREAYPEGARDFTLGESIWFALTSLTPQGGGECPKVKVQIINGTWKSFKNLYLMSVAIVTNICIFFLTGLIWKSFGCCLLALYCSHVGHIHSKPCRLSDGRKNANNCTVA